jgi:erythromycin esterase-like protein
MAIDAVDQLPRPAAVPRAVARFLIQILSLQIVASTAGAQRAATRNGGVAGAAARVARLEQEAAKRVADAVCDKQVVLLGELPEHGEARGMGVKARIVERLVARCGFRAVLVEAGSYDFFGLERMTAAHGGASADSLELALARAIGGLWWTSELAEWRRWLARETAGGRVFVGGIDDQPSATAVYARATLPALVAAAARPERAIECKAAVARYLGWGYDAAQPYDSTERARLVDCTRSAADRPSGGSPTPDQVMLGDAASYFARERANSDRGVGASLDRDAVMARHVVWWAARLPRDARIVVWTATTHAARPSSADLAAPLRERPLGAHLAERWGDRLAVVGFTALRGEWSRAGRPPQSLAPLSAHSLEARALGARGAGDTASWAYLDRAELRDLGAVPSRLFGRIVTSDWSTMFDGVVVIRDESAPTFDGRVAPQPAQLRPLHRRDPEGDAELLIRHR